MASRWLIASRAAVLVMTLISAAIAGILAWQAGLFGPGRFCCSRSGCWRRILDNLPERPHRPLDRHRPRQLVPHPVRLPTLGGRAGDQLRQSILYASLTGLVGICVELWFIVLRGPLVALLLGLGAFFVVAYTWPLKHIRAGRAGGARGRVGPAYGGRRGLRHHRVHGLRM